MEKSKFGRSFALPHKISLGAADLLNICFYLNKEERWKLVIIQATALHLIQVITCYKQVTYLLRNRIEQVCVCKFKLRNRGLVLECISFGTERHDSRPLTSE